MKTTATFLFPFLREASTLISNSIVVAYADLFSLPDCSNWEQALSEEEKKKIRQFRFEKDRGSFCRRRSLLKHILSGLTDGASPEKLLFHSGKYGKPFVKTTDSSTLYFNCSTRDGKWVLALCRAAELGIDIETNTAPFEDTRFPESFLSSDEQQVLLTVPVEAQLHALQSAWCIKEAYLKCLGTGLSIEPSSLTLLEEWNEKAGSWNTKQGFACLSLPEVALWLPGGSHALVTKDAAPCVSSFCLNDLFESKSICHVEHSLI